MQRKDLALRVLSTAAIMSIVTSIAAPAFAGTYDIGKGSIDVVTSTDGEHVHVIQNGIAYIDRDNEIVIKDGTDKNDTTLKDANRAAATPAADPAATHATQELEAAGAGPAAGESQSDPDDAFTLSEEEEDSEEGKDPTENPTDNPTATPAENPTDDPTENPKKDVVYEYDPADPEPEQQATKPASTTSVNPTAETREATLAAAPTAPAAGSATTPTTNVIKVINNWVGEAAKKLKIRLSNVNIKSSTDAAMTVSGDGNTKIELDGKNTLDSSNVSGKAGLNKQGNGTMTITDEKTDGGETRTSKAADDKTGSLTVVGGVGAAGIGGNSAPSSDSGVGDTKNITIEGYATVDATSGKNGDTGICGGAGIGGGNFGSADNIIIQGNANVTAKTGYHSDGAAIGGGAYGSGTNIGIYDHATVKATADITGAAIGRGGYGQKASVTIGSKDKTQENENVHVTAKAYYSAIGGMAGFIGNAADRTTDIVIQGGATIEEASCTYVPAIGGSSGVSNVVIRGHAVIKKAGLIGGRGSYKFGDQGDKVTVSIEDHARLENVSAIGGQSVEEANVTVKDNAYVGSVGAIGDDNYPGDKIGKLTAKILDNATIEKLSGWIGKRPNSTVDESEVIVDGGETGKVTVTASALSDKAYINAQKVEIKNNVLLKLKQSAQTSEPYYIAANGVEMTRDDLMKTIGDDAEIWYTDKGGTLQKIVHGKNVCTKNKVDEKAATCTTPGSVTYECTYEHNNHAVNPDHTGQWTENTAIDPNAHNWGDWQVTTPATCTTKGVETRYCRNNNTHFETRPTADVDSNNHGSHGTHIVGKVDATCTTPGYTGDTYCNDCNQKIAGGTTIPIDPNAHDYQDDWQVTTPATCTNHGVETRYCHNNHNHSETRPTALNGNNHGSHGTHIEGYVAPTCTKDGYTGDTYCNGCNQKIKDGTVIPATGHHWKDNGDGTHTCPDCGATEALPVNTNSALELRVVDAEGMDQPFTVSQNGTLRTYTGAYDMATLTGDLNTLRYLQDHGAQTIQFVTNGQTSSFDINDLLAQGSGSEVFYLTHRGAEEPTLLLVEADHSELVKD